MTGTLTPLDTCASVAHQRGNDRFQMAVRGHLQYVSIVWLDNSLHVSPDALGKPSDEPNNREQKSGGNADRNQTKPQTLQ